MAKYILVLGTWKWECGVQQCVRFLLPVRGKQTKTQTKEICDVLVSALAGSYPNGFVNDFTLIFTETLKIKE